MQSAYSTRRVPPLRGLTSIHSKGQALVFGLIFTAVAAVVVLLTFNSSILTIAKSQLQNAADAGAYSAAVLQARDSNFSAYTNRAMIANQVAVAQFVSLKSYFDDADQTRTRARSVVHNTVYRFFPAGAPFWDLAIQAPVNTARSTLGTLSPLAVRGIDLLIDAMDNAQQIHHLGTMAEMMLVADEVVKKNDPLARVTTSAFMLGDAAVRVTQWGNDSTKRFNANDASKEADRFADAVVSRDSTDLFIRNRASMPLAAWASTVRPFICPLAVATSTAFAFGHAGGTLLSSNKRRWLGLDATMGVGFASCTWLVPCFPTGLCPYTITVPFPDIGTQAPYLFGGHGGARAGGGGNSYNDALGYKNTPFEAKLYGGALLPISPAFISANYRYWVTGTGATLDAGGGLQSHYRDVANPTPANRPKNQTPEENGGKFPITIEVERPQDTLRLSTKVLPNSNRLRLEDGMKGKTMRALASAHAYFHRPKSNAKLTRNGWQRPDNRTEYQNLFSPYWQARLAPTSVAEESASALGQ